LGSTHFDYDFLIKSEYQTFRQEYHLLMSELYL
jgi:hypothetical protein